MAKMYYDKDADLALLKGKTIGVIGYGSQGHAHALNLRDSGCDVLVAELPGTDMWKQAEEAGFRVAPATEVAPKADVIMMLVPDQTQRQVYYEGIEGGMAAPYEGGEYIGHASALVLVNLLQELGDLLVCTVVGPVRMLTVLRRQNAVFFLHSS